MNYNFIIVASVFILFDVISGVLSAFIRGTFQSKKMREGGLHKLILILVIALGVLLDWSQGMIDLGFHLPCIETVCGYIAIMEILSIIENINKAYPDALPRQLTKILYAAGEEKGVGTTED